MAAALIEATSLMFAAKGNVWSQVLTIVFSILCAIIFYCFRYWGEMTTYLGMTLPMAVWATVTWLKNPAGDHSSQVAIQTLNRRHAVGLLAFGTAVTAFLWYSGSAADTEPVFQHGFHCDELPGGGADHAALVLLCLGICRQ